MTRAAEVIHNWISEIAKSRDLITSIRRGKRSTVIFKINVFTLYDFYSIRIVLRDSAYLLITSSIHIAGGYLQYQYLRGMVTIKNYYYYRCDGMVLYILIVVYGF